MQYSNKGYIFEVDAEYPEGLHNLHSNLPCLSQKMKIKKCNKLVFVWQKRICCLYKSSKATVKSSTDIKKSI